MPPTPEVAPIIDAAAWSVYRRRRVFVSSLPYLVSADLRWPRRPQPWDDGWTNRFGEPLAPMMTAGVDEGPLRASTFQYAPRHLLFRRDLWDDVPLADLATRVGDRLPADTRPGWDLLCGTRLPRSQEADAAPTARWLAAFGDTIGVRIPSVRERSRALGLEDHYALLGQRGLSERDLFTAQGNSFDSWAVQRRVAGAVVAWLQGCPLPECRIPAPSAVEAMYQRLCRDVRGPGGCPPAFPMAPTAVPAHLLQDDPAAVWRTMAGASTSQTFSAAAASGRGAQ